MDYQGLPGANEFHGSGRAAPLPATVPPTAPRLRATGGNQNKSGTECHAVLPSSVEAPRHRRPRYPWPFADKRHTFPPCGSWRHGGRPVQGNQSGPIFDIGTAEGGISLWQGTVGSVCSQLIQVMGLGRQPIAGQCGGAFLRVEPQGVFQVTQGIGTPLGSDCNTLALTQTQFWLAYRSQRQYPVPWGAAPRPDGLP